MLHMGDLVQAIAEAASRAEGGAAASDVSLSDAIRGVTRDLPAEDLYLAAEHFRERADIAAALLEGVVRAQPNNSRALVRLANCYWLLGSGPEPVGQLASRAIALDPLDRAAWHLWGLAESSPRDRVARWEQVATRFPDDNLALANVADNAASVAGAEHDYEMLDRAIAAYETLLGRSSREEEREAVNRALAALRAWKF